MGRIEVLKQINGNSYLPLTLVSQPSSVAFISFPYALYVGAAVSDKNCAATGVTYIPVFVSPPLLHDTFCLTQYTSLHTFYKRTVSKYFD